MLMTLQNPLLISLSLEVGAPPPKPGKSAWPWGQDVLNSHSTRNQISKEPLSIDVIELNTFKCTHWYVSLLILISSLLSSPDKF